MPFIKTGFRLGQQAYASDLAHDVLYGHLASILLGGPRQAAVDREEHFRRHREHARRCHGATPLGAALEAVRHWAVAGQKLGLRASRLAVAAGMRAGYGSALDLRGPDADGKRQLRVGESGPPRCLAGIQVGLGVATSAAAGAALGAAAGLWQTPLNPSWRARAARRIDAASEAAGLIALDLLTPLAVASRWAALGLGAAAIGLVAAAGAVVGAAVGLGEAGWVLASRALGQLWGTRPQLALAGAAPLAATVAAQADAIAAATGSGAHDAGLQLDGLEQVLQALVRDGPQVTDGLRDGPAAAALAAMATHVSAMARREGQRRALASGRGLPGPKASRFAALLRPVLQEQAAGETLWLSASAPATGPADAGPPRLYGITRRADQDFDVSVVAPDLAGLQGQGRTAARGRKEEITSAVTWAKVPASRVLDADDHWLAGLVYPAFVAWDAAVARSIEHHLAGASAEGMRPATEATAGWRSAPKSLPSTWRAVMAAPFGLAGAQAQTALKLEVKLALVQALHARILAQRLPDAAELATLHLACTNLHRAAHKALTHLPPSLSGTEALALDAALAPIRTTLAARRAGRAQALAVRTLRPQTVNLGPAAAAAWRLNLPPAEPRALSPDVVEAGALPALPAVPLTAPVDPADLPQALARVVVAARQVAAARPAALADFIAENVRHLPIPTAADDPYWRQVPDGVACCTALGDLLTLATRAHHNAQRPLDPRHALAWGTLFAGIHQLATRGLNRLDPKLPRPDVSLFGDHFVDDVAPARAGADWQRGKALQAYLKGTESPLDPAIWEHDEAHPITEDQAVVRLTPGLRNEGYESAFHCPKNLRIDLRSDPNLWELLSNSAKAFRHTILSNTTEDVVFAAFLRDRVQREALASKLGPRLSCRPC